MEHTDSRTDRFITHKSFDPLFFHFSPNTTTRYGKTTRSREQLSTEQVRPGSLLSPIPCCEHSHEEKHDCFTILLHELKQIHQLLKGSGVATVYLDFQS